MNTTVIVEKRKDGNFSAYSSDLKNHLIIGIGTTVEDAKSVRLAYKNFFSF
jgi:predicted RNase H-like HicB family nuclease